MSWPGRPVVYEVNTAVWLNDLSRAAGHAVTLADVQPSDWESVCLDGVDAIWLMGVWERSPAGLAIAKANDDLMASFREALPDLADDDVFGSPYCVRGYAADPAFGGRDGLAAARAALAARGKRLVLDYVPNHVAPDSPLVTAHPEQFISGTDADLTADPNAWIRVGSNVLAHGRDPYFPPWPDVVQLNAFSPQLRATTAQTLGQIADQCDGIRCDMAMLMINNVFAKTWGGRAGPEPAVEFWPMIIGGLRAAHPQTVLFAEAYWDLESELQQQGFDFCYDKRLYDRLVEGEPPPVRDHLRADLSYQSKLVRFLENHDEPRIASRLQPDAERAAAVAVATLPGATLWHEGEFEGRRVRPPVFLRRRPDETPDPALAAWHRRLLSLAAGASVRTGTWQLLDVTGWPDNQSCNNVLAWQWSDEAAGARNLVVVNFSAAPAQGHVRLDWPELSGRRCVLHERLQELDFDRNGSELLDPGLFVSLEPWECYLIAVT
jgi:hypothetical protein